MTSQARELDPGSTHGPVPASHAVTETVGTGAPAAGATPGAGASAAPSPGGPQTFGKYAVVREIARGGMGVVYEAFDRDLGRAVALKCIGGGVLADPEEVQRFRREARAAAQLNHPHIVPVYDVGEHDGRHYFTMALVPGGSLADQRARFAEPRAAAALVEKVARAVHHAHERGVLHRDLKPGNVLLDDHGEPLVADFGLAKLLDDAELTQTGDVLGTPAYMAPEQAGGRTRQVGAGTDVWALGVLLYELVSGRRPFPGPGRDQTLEQIRSQEPARLGVDRDLEAVIGKCLAKAPTRRYATAAELADDLGRWLRGEPLSVRPEAHSRRLWRRVRRHPRRALAALTLGLVGLAAVAVAYYASPDRPLHAAERALRRGEPVTLIGESGPPRWLRWHHAQGNVSNPADPAAPFTVQSWAETVVELLPDPQLERYRFSGEVRHESGGPNSAVGLVFGLGRADLAECFYAYLFTDVAGSAHGYQPELTFRVWRDADSGSASVTRSRPPFQPANASSAWRRLTVEVGPDTVAVGWEDGRPTRLTRDALAPRAQSLQLISPQQDLGAVVPTLLPRHGLGLFVGSGLASFRRVTVEPLAPTD